MESTSAGYAWQFKIRIFNLCDLAIQHQKSSVDYAPFNFMKSWCNPALRLHSVVLCSMFWKWWKAEQGPGNKATVYASATGALYSTLKILWKQSPNKLLKSTFHLVYKTRCGLFFLWPQCHRPLIFLYTSTIASFPGPAQLSVTYSWAEPGNINEATSTIGMPNLLQFLPLCHQVPKQNLHWLTWSLH